MNRIRETREGKGLSQKQVAIEVGVKSPSVSNWESGKTTPTPENYIAMARLFNVSVDYLMGIDTLGEQSQSLNDEQLAEKKPPAPPIDPHTYYAQRFGPETQRIVDDLLARLQAMPEDRREDAARGALTFVRGLESETQGKSK